MLSCRQKSSSTASALLTLWHLTKLLQEQGCSCSTSPARPWQQSAASCTLWEGEGKKQRKTTQLNNKNNPQKQEHELMHSGENVSLIVSHRNRYLCTWMVVSFICSVWSAVTLFPLCSWSAEAQRDRRFKGIELCNSREFVWDSGLQTKFHHLKLCPAIVFHPSLAKLRLHGREGN